MFSLDFEIEKAIDNHEAISFTDGVLNSEIYLDDETVKYDLDLRYISASAFDLRQNTPNPFTKFTTVEFDAKSKENVNLFVFDVNGKLVHQRDMISEIGINKVQFNQEDFIGAGVYYLRLVAGNNQAVIKMIMVN